MWEAAGDGESSEEAAGEEREEQGGLRQGLLGNGAGGTGLKIPRALGREGRAGKVGAAAGAGSERRRGRRRSEPQSHPLGRSGEAWEQPGPRAGRGHCHKSQKAPQKERKEDAGGVPGKCPTQTLPTALPGASECRGLGLGALSCPFHPLGL